MKSQIMTAGALIIACTSFGAGFQTLEQGASNMGTANAGATVNANADASAAFWNPSSGFNAGLKVGETKFDVAASLVVSSFDFVADSGPRPLGKSGDAGCESVVPNFYVISRLSEDFMLTCSISPTYALETDYENGWVLSDRALNSEITTVDINPSIAYKVNDYLTISGGISAQWAHGHLSQSLVWLPSLGLPYQGFIGTARVSGSSWAVGGNAGFTVNYAEDGRFGFQWRSEVNQSLKGNMHVNNPMSGSSMKEVGVDLDLPHTFTIGWYQRLRGDLKRIALMADYSYTLWSSFDMLSIEGSGTPGVKEDWRNTSRVAFGVHIYPFDSDNTVLRFGSAWDQTPVKDAQHRYSRIPCTDRIWFSGGIGQKIGNVNIDFAYTYIYFYEDPRMEGEFASTGVTGYFEGSAHVVSFQIGYKF